MTSSCFIFSTKESSRWVKSSTVLLLLIYCKNAPFEKELPIYTFQTVCIENPNLTIKDNAIKKIFNAKAYNKEEDVAIKSFLQYINNNKTVDDFTQRLDSFVEKIKQEEVNRKEYRQTLLLK